MTVRVRRPALAIVVSTLVAAGGSACAQPPDDLHREPADPGAARQAGGAGRVMVPAQPGAGHGGGPPRLGRTDGLRGHRLEVAGGQPPASSGRGAQRAHGPSIAGPGLAGARPIGPEPHRPGAAGSGSAQFGGWLENQPEIEARVRETIGGSYLAIGALEPAEEHIREAIRLETQLLGASHRATLRATNLWASLLDRTGRSTEAEPLHRRNLEDARRALGPDDPIALDAAERLGTLLWHLGRLGEAEAVLRTNVDDRRRVLQPEHPDTLRSIYLLSRFFRARGRFAEAEDLAYRYAHSIQCARGTNHPDLIVALTNQGDVFRDQGQLAQAEPY